MISGTYMRPDGYPTAVLTERGIISVVDSLEPPPQRVNESHPGDPPFGEVDGRLLVSLLTVATFITVLRYLLSKKGWGKSVVVVGFAMGGIVGPVTVQLDFILEGVSKAWRNRTELTPKATVSAGCTGCGWCA